MSKGVSHTDALLKGMIQLYTAWIMCEIHVGLKDFINLRTTTKPKKKKSKSANLEHIIQVQAAVGVASWRG